MGRRRKSDIYISHPEQRHLLSLICLRVRKARQNLNLTQQALAVKAGLSTNTVSEIEQGRVEDICLSTLVCISEVLGCSLSQLLDTNEASSIHLEVEA